MRPSTLPRNHPYPPFDGKGSRSMKRSRPRGVIISLFDVILTWFSLIGWRHLHVISAVATHSRTSDFHDWHDPNLRSR
jgi:hypothetical protein